MDPEVKFILLIVSFNGFKSDMNADTERVISLITQTISLVKSKMTETETETELMSLISETIVCFKEMDLESQPMPLRMLISLLSGTPFVNSSDWDWDEPVPDSMLMPLIRDTWSIKPQPELISLIQKIISLVDNSPELKLKSFINQLIFLDDNLSQRRDWNYPLKFLSLSRYIISQATSVDWNLQPKPESELISLTNQSVSVFNSMDVDSQPEPLRKLISLASSRFPSPNSRDSWKQNRDILDFFKDKKVEFTAKNVSEFLDKKIFLMIAEILSLETEPKLISLIHRIFSLVMSMNSTSKTFISLCPQVQVILKEGKFHVIEQGLWSRNQKWDDLLSDDDSTEAREVSWRKNKWDCLPFNWEKFILPKEEGTHFLCRGCYGENHEDNSKAPVEIKHPLHPKHSLQLALFNDDKTRQCYCCHELLRDDTARDWICGVCRRKINNDYGGYHCIKKGCLYAVHSKCATQPNVWDGIEREGESEEEVEELEPFVTISDGIIQHFSHEDHHLTLDENTSKDYDENKLCQACIMPIYFACPSLCIAGFFYKCSKRDCDFRLHVQCATISEPLLHPSHMHPLFLTSKPNEERNCSVCAKAPGEYTKETFNCIEEECDFALCFKCATLPQQVRYKHDKHILPLSYGKKTSSMTYWCEACEGKINPEEGFYKCDEYCCVNLHITCMLGKDLYLNPRSSWSLSCGALLILPNYPWMSRPICSSCRNRCPQRIFLLACADLFCSVYCIPTTRELGFLPKLQDGKLPLLISYLSSLPPREIVSLFC
ncbi:hypothetical protein AXX17_AT3G28470 [Arabidopsis thaliana]|uniref:Cysteine/Histidine-rich C1 domain family protein n=1 Tax=Arabidopsis thaliana TaxID=3702 RepID=A0A178VE43_ARATH|nr:hypothetical protein AXX17_AT3G28470 [Arabidopsis thaliana]